MLGGGLTINLMLSDSKSDSWCLVSKKSILKAHMGVGVTVLGT